MKKIIKELIPYIIILIAVLLIRTFVATPIIVSGPSMEKTLYTNDVMILNKLDKIEKNKIVVLNHNKEELIKRVMAGPNDRIKCVDGIIYVNDETQTKYGYGKSFDFEEVTLKENEYFVIGDNRDNSLDSRYFGPVTKDQILGTTNIIIFPFSRISIVS